MKALELIDSIFARPQQGPRDVRRITGDQFKYLRDLIATDPERGQVRNGQGGSLVWSPEGKYKYVVTEDPTGGKRHTLTKIANMEAVGQASLF